MKKLCASFIFLVFVSRILIANPISISGIGDRKIVGQDKRYWMLWGNTKHTRDFVFDELILQARDKENKKSGELPQRFRPWLNASENYTFEDISLNTGRNREEEEGRWFEPKPMRKEHLPERYLPESAVGRYPYSQEYWTPLMWLIAVHKADKEKVQRGDDLEAFKVLLDFLIKHPNINPNQKTEDGRSALILAIKLGYEDVVEKMIKRKVIIGQKEKKNRNLVNKNPKVTIVKEIEYTEVACDPNAEYIPVAQLQSDKRFDPSAKYVCADVNISDRVEASKSEKKGNSALHVAVTRTYEGQRIEKDDGKREDDLKKMTKIIELLLAAKCDREAVDDEGNTAFHLAISYGLRDIAEKILNLRMLDSDSRDSTKDRLLREYPNSSGEIPATTAAKNCDAALLRFLIQNGADMNDDPNEDPYTKTPLNRAMKSSKSSGITDKCVEAIEVILDESPYLYTNAWLKDMVRSGKTGLDKRIDKLIKDKYAGEMHPLTPVF